MSKRRWNQCDECGRFVGYEDLASGAALREEYTPDSAYTFETWTTLCRVCNTPTPTRNASVKTGGQP